MSSLPLVEDPPLAWTGEGFGRELSRTVRVGVNVRVAQGAKRIAKRPPADAMLFALCDLLYPTLWTNLLSTVFTVHGRKALVFNAKVIL